MDTPFRYRPGPPATGWSAQPPPAEQPPASDRQSWVLTALARLDPPAAPVLADWELSVASLLGQLPGAPASLVWAAGALRRFGAFTLGPHQVRVNEHQARWDQVAEVRLCQAGDVLTLAAVDALVGRAGQLLPPTVPYRGWITEKAAEAVHVLALAVVERISREQRDQPALVPCELVRRARWGQPHSLQIGLLPMLVYALVPGLLPSLCATAAAWRVPVSVLPEDPRAERAAQRARALRELGSAAAERIRRRGGG